jgi:hypothetical protein
MGIMNSNVAVGIGVAAAATILAPVLLPVIAGVGRPLAKSLIKGGLMLYEKGRESVAKAGEAAEDMIAEIRAEDAQRYAGSAKPASAASAGTAGDGAPRPAEDVAGTSPPSSMAGALAGNGAAAA